MAEKNLTKICGKCQAEKSVSEFGKNKYNKDGLQYWCKNCRRQYQQNHKKEIAIFQKQYYQDNKKQLLENNRQYHQNNKVQRKQYNQDNKERIVAYRKQYEQKNKKRIAKQRSQFYRDNKKELTERGKQYQQKNKKKIVARSKRYYRDNRENLLVKRRKYTRTKQGKASSKIAAQKRRALKMGVGYEVFNPVEIFERDGYICQLCGKKTRPDYKSQYHPLYPNLDHIIPLSKGGAHTRLNTQCTHRQCNAKKHNNNHNDQLRMFG